MFKTFDAPLLISANETFAINILNLSSRVCVATLRGHTGPVTYLSLLAPTTLASASEADSTVRLWNLSTSSCMTTLVNVQGPLNSVALVAGPNKTVAFTAEGKHLKLYELSASPVSKCIQTWEKMFVKVLQTLDADRVACGHERKEKRLQAISICSVSSLTCTPALVGHEAPVLALTLIGTSSLASASADRTIRIWCLRTMRCFSLERSVVLMSTSRWWRSRRTRWRSARQRTERSACGM